MNEETQNKLNKILTQMEGTSELFSEEEKRLMNQSLGKIDVSKGKGSEAYYEYSEANFDEDDPQDCPKSDSSFKKGFDYAIRILSLRDYSIHKMKQKLKERQCSPEDIEAVIEKLLEFNYLREEEYTRQRMKQLIVKGYANRTIMQKLTHEHLKADESEIEKIRNEQDLTSESQLSYLIEKKLRYKEIPTEFEAKMKLKQKVMRFCISKGFDYSQVNQAMSEYFK